MNYFAFLDPPSLSPSKSFEIMNKVNNLSIYIIFSGVLVIAMKSSTVARGGGTSILMTYRDEWHPGDTQL